MFISQADRHDSLGLSKDHQSSYSNIMWVDVVLIRESIVIFAPNDFFGTTKPYFGHLYETPEYR